MEPTVNGRQAFRPTEQQVFDHLKCEVIQSSRLSLSKFLWPERHTEFLRSRRILCAEETEEINGLPSRQKRASKFLDILEKKGAEAYDALCASLDDDHTQMFLLKELHQGFEQRQRRYRDLLGQQRSTQRLLDLSPPPLQPPPPPSHHQHQPHQLPQPHQPQPQPYPHPHHPQGHNPTPTENAYPGYLPQPYPADSCPGYSSPPPYFSSSPLSTSPLSNGGRVAPATEVSEEEKVKVVDLQKERLNVAAYLGSLSGNRTEGPPQSAAIVLSRPGSTEPPPDSSLERQLPTFLSTAATFGSNISSNDFSNGSNVGRNQAVPPAALPAPTQDSQGLSAEPNHADGRRQQRILPRGRNPQEMGIPASMGGDLGPSALPPPVVSQGPEPVENEDATADDSSLENSSFFRSLDNASLAPSSSGVIPHPPTLLCSAALHDQHKAWGKCLSALEDDHHDEDADKKEMEECVLPKRQLVDSSELSSHLSCMAVDHVTDKKVVAVQASPEPAAWQSGEEEDRSASSTAEGEGKDKAEDASQKAELAFEEGVSRELRGSVCDKSGRSAHSSQC